MNQKGFVSIALIVLIVVLTGAAVYFVFTQKYGIFTTIQQDQLSKEQISRTGWKRFEYSNDGANFSFSYPKDLKIVDGSEIGVTAGISNKIFFGADKRVPEIAFIVFNESEAMKKLGLQRSHLLRSLGRPDEKYENVTVNSLEGSRWLSSGFSTDISEGAENIVLFDGLYIYWIAVSTHSKIQSKDLFDSAVFSGKPYAITVVYKDIPTEKLNRDKDNAIVINTRQLQQGLEFYYYLYKLYPAFLELLLTDNKMGDLWGKPSFSISDFLYATNPQKQKYHLGIRLINASASVLSSDSDFNSKNAGWQNGFSGADPLYDLVP